MAGGRKWFEKEWYERSELEHAFVDSAKRLVRSVRENGLVSGVKSFILAQKDMLRREVDGTARQEALAAVQGGEDQKSTMPVGQVQGYIEMLRGPRLAFPLKFSLAAANVGMIYDTINAFLTTPHLTSLFPIETAATLGAVNAILVGIEKFVSGFHPLRNRSEKKTRDAYEKEYGTRYPEYRPGNPLSASENFDLAQVQSKWKEYLLDRRIDTITNIMGKVAAVGTAAAVLIEGIPKNMYDITPLVWVAMGGPVSISAFVGAFATTLFSMEKGINEGLNSLLFPVAKRYLDWKAGKQARAQEAISAGSV